jgi:hypothetical protein
VVSPCSRQRHAIARHRSPHPNDALCQTIFPLLRLQYPWRNRRGAVYSFDPVGSYEREACRAAGAASSLIQPFLDNQASTNFTYYQIVIRGYLTVVHLVYKIHPRIAAIGSPIEFPPLCLSLLELPQIYFKNQIAAPGTSFPKHLPLTDVVSLVTDSFTSATERHIEVRHSLLELIACFLIVLNLGCIGMVWHSKLSPWD